MNVTCNKCGKKYVISDDKVAGKTSVKIRCKQCQNLIAVAVSAGQAGSTAPYGASSPSGAYTTSPSGTFTSAPSGITAAPAGVGAVALSSGNGLAQSPDWSRSPRPPAPPAEATPVWHAMIAGKQVGPFDLGTLQKKVSGGEVTLRTYLWKPGMGDWKRAADVPEMAPLFAAGSAAATATSPMQSAPTSSTRTPAVKDVAVANEVPVPAQDVALKRNATVVYGAKESKAAAELARGAAAKAEPSADAPGAVATKPEPALGELFAGISPNGSIEGLDHVGPSEGAPAGAAVADPFAQLGPLKEGEAPPPGETTKFFIAKAGVNKRNPPWKIALFVAGGVGIPLGLVWLLSTFHVIPTVTRTNEQGQEVQEEFFSAGGFSGLKDALTGDGRRKKEEADRAKAQAALVAARAAAKSGQGGNAEPKAEAKDDDVPPPPKPQNPDLKALYADDSVGNTKLKVRKDDQPSGSAVVNASGLSQESAMKIIADKKKAFDQCVETALHRNPNLAVGNIVVKISVGSSGAVKSAWIEPKKHEGADWAQCMAGAAKRIVFPSSDGETELELPFKVGVAIVP